MFHDDLASLINRFDAFYDIYQAYDLVLPALEAFMDAVKERGGPSETELPNYVGSAWCRMVATDVRHELPVGAKLLAETQKAALILADVVAGIPKDDPGEQALFSRYVVARWLDGAAKLLYRLGDHTQARLWDRQAFGLVEGTVLDARCRADIASNQMRNLAEEVGQVGRQVELKFEDEIRHAVERLPKPLQEIKSGNTQALQAIRTATTSERELARGICSLYHNWSTTAQDKAMKIAYSKRAELIARALGDKYRIAQAIHNQALFYRDELPEVSATIWRRLSKSPDWRRGQLMALQQLSILRQLKRARSARGQLQNCVRGFEGLLRVINEIQARQRGIKGEDALDVDLYGYTVKEASKSLTNIKNLLAGDDQLPDGRSVRSLEDRMHRELKQMVSAYRNVVKVATYKHAFGKYFAWAYDELIGVEVLRALRAGSADNVSTLSSALRWIEEATSRDLLDMAANRLKVDVSGPELIFRSEDSATGDQTNTRVDLQFPEADEDSLNHAAPSLREIRHKAPDITGEIRQQVTDQYHKFDEFSKENPRTTFPIPANIFEQTRQFSQLHDCVVLRFFVDGEQYGCMRFNAGQCDLVMGISIERSEHALETMNKIAGQVEMSDYLIPAAGLSEAIGKEVLEPLLHFTTAEGTRSLVKDNQLVVFIPSGGLMALPLHIGKCGGRVANLRWPTLYCGNCASLIAKQRFRNCWVTPSAQDRLAAVICTYGQQQFGLEALEAVDDRFSDRVVYTGQDTPLANYTFAKHLGKTSHEALVDCLKHDYEYLAIGAHGQFVSEDDKDVVIHPYLDMADGSIATPYTLACIEQPMLRNHLVIVGACVTAQGANLSGGEISGFYRGLVAAGAGAVAMPFVPVESTFVAPVTAEILGQLMQLEPKPPVFLPELLRRAFIKKIGARKHPGYHAACCLFGLFV